MELISHNSNIFVTRNFIFYYILIQDKNKKSLTNKFITFNFMSSYHYFRSVSYIKNHFSLLKVINF